MLLSMMHVSMIHVSMIHLSMMNVFLDAYIYDGGTLSVTEEKKKKDFYSSSIRLGCMGVEKFQLRVMVPQN